MTTRTQTLAHACWLSLACCALPGPAALAGTHDGSYSLHYAHLDATVACGYVDATGQIDGDYERIAISLVDEQIPAGTLDVYLERVDAYLDEAGVPEAQQETILAAAASILDGMELMLNAQLNAYPDVLTLTEIEGDTSLPPYSYWANARLIHSASSVWAEADAVVDGLPLGAFGLEPLYEYDVLECETEGLTYYPGVGLTMTGMLGAGIGAFLGGGGYVVEDTPSSALYGCGVATLTGFDVDPIAAEKPQPAKKNPLR